jgi:hypothetical protein
MLGLGANISGGSPVGIVGAAAPAPLSDYFYESDMVSDEFNVFGTIVLNRISEYVGKENVISIASSTSNPAYLYTYISSCPTIVGNSYCRFEITYFIPTGSEVFNINASKNGGTYTTLLNSLTIGSWVTQTSSDILFDRGNVSSLLFRFAVSGDPIIYISSIKVIDVTDQYPLVGSSPPPGGYYDGALDQSSLSYVGAAAAYSLRLVYSYYDGSAIRVRRASDNAEQDIGFSNGVLDTSTLSTFCSGTNGFVKTWYDQSLNGWDFTQATTASQPKIYDSVDGVVINPDTARPSAYFAVGNFIKTANYQVIRTKDYAQFQVHKLADASMSNTTRFTDNNLSKLYNQYDLFYFFDGTQAGLVAEDENTNLFTYNRKESENLITWHKNGALVFTRDNYLSASWPVVNAGQYNTFQLGSTFSANPFYFDELVAYNSDQSTNRTGIEANINDFYQMYWSGAESRLLDSHPNAAAAFSLRALNSNYTGPLVRVRRASDNAEQDVLATYDGELNVEALATFCAGTDGFIKTWYDQSGNGNDATQTSNANQPKIYDGTTASVVTENGKPIINLVSGNSCTLLLNTTITSSTTHIFGVAELDSTNNKVMIGKTAGTGIYIANNNDPNTAEVGSSLYINGASSLISTRDQLSDQFQNQTSFNSIQNLSTASQTRIGMPNGGGDDYKMFNMQEIIFYSSDQSSNRAAIEANINAFYSIY